MATAKFKISELTEATSASDGDYLIINEGDTETKKINVSNLGAELSLGVPYIHDFLIDEANSNDTGTESFSVDSTKQNVTAEYESWSAAQTANGVSGSQPIKDVAVSNTKEITMPAGADSAIIIYEGGIQHNTKDDVTGVIGAWRYVKTSHRIQVQGATFAFDTGTPDSFGVSLGGPIELTTNNTAQWGFQADKRFYSKTSAISFTEGATVKFTAKMNVNKAGRASVTGNIGRMIVIPFKNDGNVTQAIVSGAAATGYNLEAEDDGVVWSTAVEAQLDCRGPREMLRRVIFSLESRKNNKPATSPATDAEYNQLIADSWAILDDYSLTDYDKLTNAVNNILAEAVLPKYGIGTLFAYETAFGVTGTSLF